MRQRFLFIILLLLVNSAWAEPVPDIWLDLKLKTITGHELGYGPPQEGSHCKFRLDELKEFDMLTFGSKMEYVPLPTPLQIVDVRNAGEKWSSLRARAEKDGHRVTFDLVRIGSGNQVRSWILIESRERISGVLYLEGVFMQK